MGYQSDAIYGPGDPGGSLPPSMLNTGAVQPSDIFLTGIANAAVNAINNATGATMPAVQQAVLQQTNSLVTLAMVGVFIWLVVGHK